MVAYKPAAAGRCSLDCPGCNGACQQPHSVQPSHVGWVCPKCGAANSPGVDQCPCSRPPIFSTTIV